MATKTYQEQLETVQTAIETIVTTGQSYTIGTRSYTRANLKDLIQYEQYLRAQAAREAAASDGVRIFRGVPWR